MPIYEYQCEACNQKFEILQKLSDNVLTQCPSCKQEKLRKMVTAAAFRLKGGGWYETDFKDKKSQKNTADGGDGAAKPDKAPAADSGSGVSDTKPAAAEKPATESKPAAATPAKTTTD